MAVTLARADCYLTPCLIAFARVFSSSAAASPDCTPPGARREHGDVLLLTKRSLFDSATAYAQGGIAAALGAGDSPELHRQDTLAAGAALCDAAAVQVLVEEGPARVRELQTAGADFDLDPKGRLMLGREAAHSKNRIVHAHGDQTGAEVARTLVARVRRRSASACSRARACSI